MHENKVFTVSFCTQISRVYIITLHKTNGLDIISKCFENKFFYIIHRCVINETFMTLLLVKTDSDKSLKGTSRGPEALQNHLNDSCYTNVLCW